MQSPDLPSELCIKIILLLDGTGLRSLSLSCAKWYKLSRDEKLWERICILNGFTGPISPPLIQDLSGSQEGKEGKISWKKVYIKALKVKQKQAFFDWLIKRSSEDTLFGNSPAGLQIPFAMKAASAASLLSLNDPEDFQPCKQCEREGKWKTLDHLDCRQESRLHSLLWDQGSSTLNFVQHTLRVGCWWLGNSVSGGTYTRNDNTRIPKEFLLEFTNQDRNNEVNLSRRLELLNLLPE